MSTRAFIARQTPTGFRGRYHHSDGYPAGLGRTLWQLRNAHFNRETAAMLKLLIDEHPAGWSSIVYADFQQKPGYYSSPDASRAPRCYCHGERHERACLVTPRNAAEMGCEYGYVFSRDGATMRILKASFPEVEADDALDVPAVWEPLADIPLNGPEPEWERIA